MIYNRKPGRLVPTLRVRYLSHDKHETAAGSEFELIGNGLALYSGHRRPTRLRAQLERTMALEFQLKGLQKLNAFICLRLKVEILLKAGRVAQALVQVP